MARIAPQKFLSSDNKEFDTALEADAHDVALKQSASVEAYIAAANLAPAEGTRAKKYISGYTAFMANEAATSGEQG